MSSRATEAGRPLAVLFLVIALVVLAALAGPARAAAEDPTPPGATGPSSEPVLSETDANETMNDLFENGEFWTLDENLRFAVLEELLLEIALLHHLEAYRSPAPSFVQDIHDAYAPWPDPVRDTVVDFLFSVDDRLADLKNEVNGQVGPAPILAFALDKLPVGPRNGIISGGTGVVDVVPYARALNEVMSYGNSEWLAAKGARDAPIIADLPIELSNPLLPVAIDELRAETATLRADVDGLRAAAPDPADPPALGVSSDAGAGFPWAVVLGATGGLVAIALFAWLTRRRRRASHVDDGPATAEVFEAHRRLAAALDEVQIGEIGSTTAVSITSAGDAFIFRQTPDGLRRIGDTAVAISSALARVVETAQPLVTVLDRDAAVGTAAVCAVPLVNDGTVGAVLVARRPPDQPFGNEDRRRLEMLAPALGAALASADTLGSYEHMALVDGLTSLGNRRRLDGDLETTLSEAAAENLPVAFAMIDVDHFKCFNDTHGHEAGDRALQAVARVITETVRATDIVYRYGGEEFSVLLPGASIEEATAAGERMRAAVEAARIDGEESQPGGRLTISVGISTLEAGDADALKTRADEALYEAKSRGRNRAVIA